MKKRSPIVVIFSMLVFLTLTPVSNANSPSVGINVIGNIGTSITITVPISNIPIPYPNNPSASEKEVNMLIEIANSARTCTDVKSWLRQLNYVAQNAPVALAQAQTQYKQAERVIIDLDRSLGGCQK